MTGLSFNHHNHIYWRECITSKISDNVFLLENGPLILTTDVVANFKQTGSINIRRKLLLLTTDRYNMSLKITSSNVDR